jgi:uncharacterized membrane protein
VPQHTQDVTSNAAPARTTKMPPWRLVAAVLGIAIFLALSHWLTLHSAGRPWAIAAFLGPGWVVALAVAARKRKVVAIAALLSAVPIVGAVVALGGIGDVKRLYVLEHAGIHLALFATFARTLRRGRLSLIGQVAERVHGTLAPDVVGYTRRVTVAWALYFLAMAFASVVVYAACDWIVWSLLANAVTPLAITGLYLGEYVLRYRLHPEFERATLAQAARAYLRRQPTIEATGS